MVFTDDDLEKLRGCFTQGEGFWKGDKPSWMKLSALLFRLESAEKLGDALRNRGSCYCEAQEGAAGLALNHVRQCVEERAAVEAWRKAAGK
jgi:hypothetical protein